MHIYADVYDDISVYKISDAKLQLLFNYRRQSVSEMYRVVQKSPYPYLPAVFHCERRRLCVASLSRHTVPFRPLCRIHLAVMLFCTV